MSALVFGLGGLAFGVALGMKLSEWASGEWRASAQRTLDGLHRAVHADAISWETANRICDGWKP